jgi:hypothetical protein
MALSRFLRRREAAATPDQVAANGSAAPVRRPLPQPGQLRRERRQLLRARERRVRDLGGLMLEMYRRDQFRQDLLVDRCAELLSLEERLQELDTLLQTAISVRRTRPAARCECGAPILWGTHFCANCGRTVGEAVVACGECGGAVPAGAKFCAACGHVVGGEPEPAPEKAGAPAAVETEPPAAAPAEGA